VPPLKGYENKETLATLASQSQAILPLSSAPKKRRHINAWAGVHKL